MLTSIESQQHSAVADTPRIRFARAFARGDTSLRLYALLDAETCARVGVDLIHVASCFRAAGVRLIQYRDKPASRESVLANASALRKLFPEGEAYLILNDHPELVGACGFDGVHVGQDDVSVAEAREQIGPDRILGISTHSADQAIAAHATEADYVAVGPVFSTTTKKNAEPAVGLCGVQAVRAVTSKPLVAIGGIRLGDARAVEMAGADAIAAISALVPSTDVAAIVEAARAFMERLR